MRIMKGLEINEKIKRLSQRILNLEAKKEHIHCKICKRVIEKPINDYSTMTNAFNSINERDNQLYYDLKVCRSCVKIEGIKKIKGRKS